MRRYAIKLLAPLAVLTTLAVGTPAGVTPAAAQQCGYAPNCDGLRGEDRRQCQADRAAAEADCQLHDTRPHGDARNDPGPGQKHQDCLDKAEKLRGAPRYGRPTTYAGDC